MKFYVASRIKNRDFVKKIHQEIINKGHTFTSGWVNQKNIIPYEKHKQDSSKLAIECIKQINDCDVFILISDENGAGMYTELGIALQLSNQKNKPKIYIIGKYNERSVFFFHPLIIRVKTLEEIFTDLENT